MAKKGNDKTKGETKNFFLIEFSISNEKKTRDWKKITYTTEELIQEVEEKKNFYYRPEEKLEYTIYECTGKEIKFEKVVKVRGGLK